MGQRRPTMRELFQASLLALTALLVACGPSATPEAQHSELQPEEESSGDNSEATDGSDSGTDEEDTRELVVGEDACETDADCVPAGCCHAAACVAQNNAPDCSETMCTMDCRFGTLDCGGNCLCHEGRCAARLSEPVTPTVQ